MKESSEYNKGKEKKGNSNKKDKQKSGDSTPSKKKDKKKDRKNEKEVAPNNSLKKYSMAAAILMILAVPVALNFKVDLLLFNSKTFEIPQGVFSYRGNEEIGPDITGATKDEVQGYIKSGKNCAVFYSENPPKDDQAVATRVCPELHDVDIRFHLRGVYGTHPFANASRGDPAQVAYIVSGSNVWTTFFDQHNTSRQTYTVPPGLEMNISSLMGSAGVGLVHFPPLFDTVRVLHSVYFVQRTRGLQVTFPDCVNFYAAMNPTAATLGFLACRQSKKKSTQVIDYKMMQSLGLIDHRGEMQELTYIVPGSKASVKIEFQQDPESTEPLPVPEVLLARGRSNKVTGNEIYDAVEHQGEEWRIRPKVISITYAADVKSSSKKTESSSSADSLVATDEGRRRRAMTASTTGVKLSLRGFNTHGLDHI